uniref:Uncharacterized protein n=1 Tax=Cacopsylla melanoneura TaxID=428564 RepID=A0A8D8X9W3_9HEMI
MAIHFPDKVLPPLCSVMKSKICMFKFLTLPGIEPGHYIICISILNTDLKDHSKSATCPPTCRSTYMSISCKYIFNSFLYYVIKIPTYMKIYSNLVILLEQGYFVK